MRSLFLVPEIRTGMFMSGTDCLFQCDEFDFRSLFHARKVNALGHSLIGIDIVLSSQNNPHNEEAIESLRCMVRGSIKFRYAPSELVLGETRKSLNELDIRISGSRWWGNPLVRYSYRLEVQ